MPQLDQATFFSQLITILLALSFLFIIFNSIVLPKVYQTLRLREIAVAEATFQIENVCTLYGLTSFNYKNSLDVSMASLENLVADINFLIKYDEFIFHFYSLNMGSDGESADVLDFIKDIWDINDSIELKNAFSLYFNFYFMNIQNMLYCYMLNLNDESISFDEEDAELTFEYEILD